MVGKDTSAPFFGDPRGVNFTWNGTSLVFETILVVGVDRTLAGTNAYVATFVPFALVEEFYQVWHETLAQRDCPWIS